MALRRIFFVIFAIVFMLSCSEEDSAEYHYELLPIEDTVVPEEFEFGKIYTISVKYMAPDDCYINGDVLYEYDDDARNVAVISLVIDNNDCETIGIEQELVFQVQALQASPYIFRFWQGEDDKGEPIYLTIEVPVINIVNHKAEEFEATHSKM